jgi:hypothetical protein
MNAISNWFLRAAPSLLFLLFVLIYVLEKFALRLVAPERSVLWSGVLSEMDLLLILMWMWAAGSFLESVVPAKAKFDLTVFRAALVYLAAYPFLTASHLLKDSWLGFSPRLPLLLFAWVCTILVLNLLSKSLVWAETGNVTSFFDYALDFLLIAVFAVIGVWFIQPRINRLYAKSLNIAPPVILPAEA